MMLPVTLVTAAAAAIINLWLAFGVSRIRVASKVSLGHGGDPALEARVRAHANFVEYAPFVLILVGAIELARGPGWWLWVLASAFLLARLAHGIGMTRPAPNPLRAGGALVTWVVLAALALWALDTWRSGLRPIRHERVGPAFRAEGAGLAMTGDEGRIVA